MNPSVNYKGQDEETDAVLTAFAQAQSAPSGASLSEWTARYPAQARDLARLAAQSWAGDDRETALPESVSRCHAIGLTALRAFRPEPKRAEVITFSAAPMTSLLAAAEAAGKDADTVASLLDLPSALFWKLHRRLISPDSVPRSLVAALADSVNRTMDEVASYLRMPPQMATGASFRSDNAPSVGQQESFEEALQAEPETTEASSRRWLRDGEAG
ncbi:MAG: hypothetical protein V4671_24900 [Armatimonadota bacterium]